MTLFIAMCLFALSMSATPGPVNLICLTSGVQNGFKRTLPFVFGATLGFVVLLTLIGLGLSSFVGESLFFFMLRYAGGLFIAYVGLKLMFSNSPISVSTARFSPPTLSHGIIMQWLNPKAWMACIAGSAAFDVANSNDRLMLFVGVYFAICYCSIAAWALLGHQLSRSISNSTFMALFGRVMGSALICIAIYLMC